jgi:hypothetical protein
MNCLRLNKSLTLSVESYNGKLRFVVIESGHERVCRIERKKAIAAFLQTESSSIFKGRLQLHKHRNEIAVEVKGEVVANIPLSSFQKLIS